MSSPTPPETPTSDTKTSQAPRPLTRIFLWSVWVIYVSYVLLSDFPPGASLFHTEPATLKEAMDLSLNFWFVMPLALPKVAPTLSPTLESLFNVTVAWGLLFWGFAIDGRYQRFSVLPFLIGTVFLTNVFYLPWLALRRGQTDAPTGQLTPLERLGESRVLPWTLVIVVIVSFVWAAFGRPEFGDLTVRLSDFQSTVASDRLAYSFVIDLATFWLFQGWLVKDDMVRRQWTNTAITWVAKIVPFFGLVIYLLARPPLPEIEEVAER